jgi:hypothetical protein
MGPNSFANSQIFLVDLAKKFGQELATLLTAMSSC